MLVLSGVASAVPALLYLIFVWWVDRYDREPPGLVAVAFGWGAVGAVGLSVAGSSVLMVPVTLVAGPEASWGLGAVLVAPLVEETAKGCILLALALHRRFDGLVDGMVYGAAVGLGFALSENFGYYLGSYQASGFAGWAATVFVRTSCSTLTHAVATSAVGAAIGAVKYTSRAWLRWVAPPLGLVAAMGIHGLYNAASVFTKLQEDPSWFVMGTGLLVLELVVGFAVVQVALLGESAALRRELEAEVASGVIGPEALAVVPSWWRRIRFLADRTGVRGGWTEGAAFLRLATDLAVRKQQLRFLDGDERADMEAEVASLRESLRGLERRGRQAQRLKA